ncbi:MAG: hypothetical protein JW730_06850 [Anaerolineales bacterium]|nr:hypothetical protein [Anaerolineales bacterium]
MFANSITTLKRLIQRLLRSLIEFLTVMILGLVATFLIVLPWLLRALALMGWLAGTFLAWLTVSNLYSAFTPVLPLIALTSVPAILSVALVVWLFYRGQQGHLWGAMALWGVIGFLVWKGSMLLTRWQYGTLVIQVLPAALCAVLLLYINLRWGLVIRARRFAAREFTTTKDRP